MSANSNATKILGNKVTGTTGTTSTNLVYSTSPTISTPTVATSLTASYSTASTIGIFDGSKNLISADTATYPSLTELTYVKGVTSAIQTQLNAKFTLPSLTAGSILFSDGSTIVQDNANFFYDDTNNRLGLGTATPTYRLDILGTSLSTSGINFSRVSTDTFSSTLNFTKARGTVGSESVITAGDLAMRIQASAYDGTAYDSVGNINFFAQGISGGIVSGSFSIGTANTAGSVTTGLFIDDSQLVGMGTSSPAARLHLAGNISASSWGVNGIQARLAAATYTDTSSSGTVASVTGVSIAVPTLAASSSTTYTTASTLYIAGTPAAGTNVTITTPYALYIAAGNSRFGGGINTQSWIQFGTSSNIIYDSNANELLTFTRTTSAVNELNISNNTTGNAPALSATGGDTNISLNLVPKGTGRVQSGGVTVPTISSTDTFTNKTMIDTTNVVEEITTTASSSTPTPTGGSRRNFFTVTALAAGATFAAPSGTPVEGNRLVIRVKDNGTARTLAFNAIYRAIGVTLPTTTVISKTLYLGCIYNSADTKWDVIAYSLEV